MADCNSDLPRDVNGDPIPVLRIVGSLNIDFTATPDNNNALSGESSILMISSTLPCWVLFGTGASAVTAKAAGAFLCPAGVVSLSIGGATHVSVVSAGTDGTVCFAEAL